MPDRRGYRNRVWARRITALKRKHHHHNPSGREFDRREARRQAAAFKRRLANA